MERAGRNPHGAWVPPRAAPAAPAQNTRLPDFRVQPNTKHEPGRPSRPANREQVSPAPVDAAGAGGSGDHSPLIYILPGLVALATLAVGAGYAIHTSGRARRAGMGA